MSKAWGTLSELWFLLFGPFVGYWLRGIIKQILGKDRHGRK